MNKTIITTVGTSLLTNFFEDKTKQQKSSYGYEGLKKLPFYLDTSVSADNRDGYIKNCQKLFTDTFLFIKNNENACAEISSIFAIAEHLCKVITNTSEKLELILFFVCTDTILSPLCAEVIATYLNEKKQTFAFKNNQLVDINVSFTITTPEFISQKDSEGKYKTIIENIKVKDYECKYIVKGLTVNNNTDFQNAGFEGLSSVITNITFYSSPTRPNSIKEDEIKKNIKKTIVNITGGYKGFIPVLTLICQLLDVEMQYLYEESKTIITIPKLPIQFDLSVIESLASHLNNDYLKKISKDTELYKLLNEYKLINDNIEMSGIGQILHNHLFNGQIGLSNSILGSFIELKLFHYFSTCNHTKYHSPIKNDEADYYAYKISNGAYEFSEKQANKPDDKKIKELGYIFNLGDIDLVLKNEMNRDSLCEIKAHHTFSETYARELSNSKPKDYYDKVKARIEFWKHTRRTLPNEYLFIVYKIRILQGDESEFLTENTQKMIRHFSDHIKQDYGEDVKFKILGLWVYLKDYQINYSSLLQEAIQDDSWMLNLEKND